MSAFLLIETMRWEPGTGIARLPLHMARLKKSASQLGFAGADKAEEKLAEALAESLPTSSLRIRLTLSPAGEIAVTTVPYSVLPEKTVWRLAIASTRLSSRNILLRHKTSRRDIYEAARSEYTTADADEVLLLNENGDPCEGTITSLFLDEGSGILKTPPISNGLLAGVLRTELICQRRARVQRLTREDLGKGTIYMGNSLRGLIRAQLRKED